MGLYDCVEILTLKEYIVSMTPEEIKEYNERSKKEFEKFKLVNKNDLFGFVVPLFLFFAGMAVPFFTDRTVVMWFALAPFYSYHMTIVNIESLPDEMKRNDIISMGVTFVISLLLTACWATFMDNTDGPLGSVVIMGICNVIPSFASYYWGIIFKNMRI